jgi:hypothetical protein
VEFFASDFGGVHSAFRLTITCTVRRYGFLLHNLPPDVCRPYLAAADSVVWYAIFRIFEFRVFETLKPQTPLEVYTHDQMNCATRHFPLPAEFGGLDVPSFAIDVEPTHYASFDATLAIHIIDCKSESLGPLYGIIRRRLHDVATSTLPWAVQFQARDA